MLPLEPNIGNPYLDELISVQGKEKIDWDDFFSSFKLDTFSLNRRTELVIKYAWAVPNQAAIETIIKYADGNLIIEPCAGKGYWASLIDAAGGRIWPFDIEEQQDTYYPVNCIVNKSFKDYLRREHHKVLFLCWPPYASSCAYDYLKDYFEFGGKTVIYVGEWCGCTADNQFHEYLEDKYDQVECVDIPQWYGLNDSLFVFKRKN